MNQIIAPPVPAVLEIAELLEAGIKRFLLARDQLPELGKFESDIEALNLFNLVIRNIEALATLARTDLVLYPAAQVLARAIFEISVKTMWLVRSDDFMEREVRWLAHIKEEERAIERLAKISKRDGRASFQRRLRAIREFRTGVTGKLPAGYKELAGNPSMEQMLQDLGQQHLYGMYIMLAQFVHGGHSATWLYRKGLGVCKKGGEYISTSDWYLPLHAATTALRFPAVFILVQLGLEQAEVLDFRMRRRIRVALEKIKDHKQN